MACCSKGCNAGDWCQELTLGDWNLLGAVGNKQDLVAGKGEGERGAEEEVEGGHGCHEITLCACRKYVRVCVCVYAVSVAALAGACQHAFCS